MVSLLTVSTQFFLIPSGASLEPDLFPPGAFREPDLLSAGASIEPDLILVRQGIAESRNMAVT